MVDFRIVPPVAVSRSPSGAWYVHLGDLCEAVGTAENMYRLEGDGVSAEIVASIRRLLERIEQQADEEEGGVNLDG
jgi:hypothetical protein